MILNSDEANAKFIATFMFGAAKSPFFSHLRIFLRLGGKFNPRAALITRNKDMLRSLYTIELLKCNEIPSWVVKFARSPIAKSYSWTWLPRFRFEASLRLAWGDWLILLLNQYASKPASIVVFS